MNANQIHSFQRNPSRREAVCLICGKGASVHERHTVFNRRGEPVTVSVPREEFRFDAALAEVNRLQAERRRAADRMNSQTEFTPADAGIAAAKQEAQAALDRLSL
jgi:hypothetical protein